MRKTWYFVAPTLFQVKAALHLLSPELAVTVKGGIIRSRQPESATTGTLKIAFMAFMPHLLETKNESTTRDSAAAKCNYKERLHRPQDSSAL